MEPATPPARTSEPIRRWRKPTLGLALVILLAWAAGRSVDRMAADPPPPESFAFAALGDAPYYAWEENQYRRVLRQLDRSELSWVLHVGDIFWRPCSDAMYQSRLAWFQNLRHPVIYTPGDNEWTDCHEPGSGSFSPLERLDRLRELFYPDPTRSLGRRRLELVSQGGREPFPEFVENTRWSHRGVVFTTVHLVGSWNGLKPFAGRGEKDDAEVARRTWAATVWMKQAFDAARALPAAAVVVAFHAQPFLEEPLQPGEQHGVEPFLSALEEEVARFPGPVLLIHGDYHDYTVDQPMVRRSTGEKLENLTRLQVPGSPDVAWVQVVVTPGAARPFQFERRPIPGWMIW